MTQPIVTRLKTSASRALGRRPSPPDPAAVRRAERWADPIRPTGSTGAAGPRIVLLNDCRDQINFGANALVDGLIDLIRDAVPDATLHPIPSHWLIDTSHGLDAFAEGGLGMRPPKAVYPKVADQFDAIADEWLDGRAGAGAERFLEKFRGADLVVLNGEGSIYRTNLSAVRELFLAWLCRERLDIPTIYVNGGIHLTDVMPILPAMVRRTFPALDAVAIREAPSLRNLQAHVPDVDATLYPDAAFVFTPDDARETPAVRAIRERIGDQPYFCFDPGAMPMDDRSGHDSTLRRLVTSLETLAPQAVFVNSGPADSYIGRIAADVGALYVDSIVDYRELMALVSGAQFQVSGRYHNIILAAIMGCPSLALGSSSHKVHGACEMLDGAVGVPFDGTHLVPRLDDVIAQATTYVRDRDAIATRLRGISEQRRSEVAGLGRLVAESVGGR